MQEIDNLKRIRQSEYKQLWKSVVQETYNTFTYQIIWKFRVIKEISGEIDGYSQIQWKTIIKLKKIWFS